MSNSVRQRQIGLDRLVRLNWLEKTAYLVIAGNDLIAVKVALQKEISGAFRSKNFNVRGSLDKTISILMKILANVPRELRVFNEEGPYFFSHLPRERHIAIHWGMIVSVNPFWWAVATHVGRLLTLQGKVSAAQVQRRLRELYGERGSVFRRVRYVLRSFVDWRVLNETHEKGVYGQGKQYSVVEPKFIAWMVEASLRARSNGSAAMKELIDSPSIFPFGLAHMSAEHLVSLSPRLEILRHGLDDDLVMLR